MLTAEVLGTFCFIGIILSMKQKNNDSSGTVKGFTIAMTLTGCVCMIGGISGGCLNPAVGII